MKEAKELEQYSGSMPIPRAFYKNIFKEDDAKVSPIIAELGIQDRFMNTQLFHGDIESVARLFIDHSLYGLGTGDAYYLPLDNKAEWINAGSPPPPSKYHIPIRDPKDVPIAASRDATFLKTNLQRLRDRS